MSIYKVALHQIHRGDDKARQVIKPGETFEFDASEKLPEDAYRDLTDKELEFQAMVDAAAQPVADETAADEGGKPAKKAKGASATGDDFQ